MPRTIRRALAERLLNSPEAAEFLEDFSRATGLPLRFATPLGEELSLKGVCPEAANCRFMRETPERRKLCAQTVQEMIAMAGERGCGAGVTCVAGLREAAVPLRVGGEVFGYLLVGQVATRPFDPAVLNRWRHALERSGERVWIHELASMTQDVPVVNEASFRSALRILEWSVHQLAEKLEMHLGRPADSLPPQIHRACSYMRSHLDESLPLQRVAEVAGMSREHFCTVFHRSTGLRFTEYLTRVRVERACELLQTTHDSVIDVSHACGFATVSHFNRCFRSVTGTTPTRFRRDQAIKTT